MSAPKSVAPGIAAAMGRVRNASAEPANPIVSAVQFSHLTRTTGGATMNAHTREFTQIGDNGYAVGGMRADKPLREYGELTASGRKSNSTRRRIPARNVDAIPGSVTDAGSDLPLNTVMEQTRRIRRMTQSNPQANIGSWSLGNGKVSIDASEVERDLPTAKVKGVRRGEDAIFDFSKGEDIELPTSRKQKKRP